MAIIKMFATEATLPFLAFFFVDLVTSGAVCSIIRMWVIICGSCGSWLEIVTMALCRVECRMRT